jgi:hypothetical protein
VNRFQATLGGPLWRDQSLSFFLAGQLEGRKYLGLGDGWNDVPLLLQDGTARLPVTDNPAYDQKVADYFGRNPGDPAVFTLPRDSEAPDGTDSVSVAFPDYTVWDNGRNRPFNPSDEYTLLAKLSWAGLGRGNNLDLSWKRERDQRINLDLGNIYNSHGYTGNFSVGDVFTLGGYFLISQRTTSAIALDLKASYMRFFNQNGPLDPEWLLNHRDPTLGINLGNMDFLVDADDYPVSRKLMEGSRSNAFPAESLMVYPGRSDLRNSQGLPGLTDPLRMNPYGLRTGFPISGFGGGGTNGLSYQRESNWIFSGTVDWQAGRTLRVQAGGELAKIHMEGMFVPLESSRSMPELYDPTRGGLFATGRLDLGDVVIDAGLRWDVRSGQSEVARGPAGSAGGLRRRGDGAGPHAGGRHGRLQAQLRPGVYEDEPFAAIGCELPGDREVDLPALLLAQRADAAAGDERFRGCGRAVRLLPEHLRRPGGWTRQHEYGHGPRRRSSADGSLRGGLPAADRRGPDLRPGGLLEDDAKRHHDSEGRVREPERRGREPVH